MGKYTPIIILVIAIILAYITLSKYFKKSGEGTTTIGDIVDDVKNIGSGRGPVYGCKDGTIVKSPKDCKDHGGAEVFYPNAQK